MNISKEKLSAGQSQGAVPGNSMDNGATKTESVDDSTIKKNLLVVLRRETESLNNLLDNLPSSAVTFTRSILHTKGRLVFSGMGKSGHIAKKLVATFSSMGFPAIFLHPSEALHGDLGMVQPADFFIALSKSGTGKELLEIIRVLKMQGNETALICCRGGVLTTAVDFFVQLPFEREACEMNLAPTSSSTVMIAFGDAVAVTVSRAIGFEQNDFARTHPAGALGKRLLSTVQNFMYSGDDLPIVNENDLFKDVIFVTTSKKLGSAIVLDDDKNLVGIVTDGDLRRACECGPALFEKTARDIMTKNPKQIEKDLQALVALEIMEKFNITSLIVSEEGRVVGLIHIHDLIKAGIKK